MRWIALLLIPVSLAPAQTLRRRIERLLDGSPAARRALWGIEARQAASGRALFQLNAERLFVPASNTKLFTAAAALARLGPDYRFRTTVLAERAPDEGGRVRGEIRLVGGGDPTLGVDNAQGLDWLADQVAATGVRRIDGDIVGDDTAYVWEPYPQGWEQDDTILDYGAPVSALTVNGNTVALRLQATGRTASVFVIPPVEYYAIDNRIRTVAAGGGSPIHVHRAPGSLELELSGTIPLGGPDQFLALGIEDPAEYAALALRQLLEERGIRVNGAAVARHLLPGDQAPAEGESVVLA
ncbi:MAG: D-alanyl-D-alanine carboxypeptidase/D-alanyl-D-alanine-endopeptidase, partial [Bryobacteraceae bacterium]